MKALVRADHQLLAGRFSLCRRWVASRPRARSREASTTAYFRIGWQAEARFIHKNFGGQPATYLAPIPEPAMMGGHSDAAMSESAGPLTEWAAPRSAQTILPWSPTERKAPGIKKGDAGGQGRISKWGGRRGRSRPQRGRLYAVEAPSIRHWGLPGEGRRRRHDPTSQET